MAWVGVAILSASVALVLVSVALAWWDWQRDAPKHFYAGVRVRVLEGAVWPWFNLEDVLDEVQERVDGYGPQLRDWCLEVVPWGQSVQSELAGPTPQLSAGTVRVERFLGLGPARYVAVVVQYADARKAAIAHEVGHIVNYRLTADWDFNHTSKWFKEV